MVAADSDLAGALLHRADDDIRLIAKIPCALELRQGVLGTVDVSVWAAIHAHATVNTARFVRGTGGFDGDAGAAMVNPGFAEPLAVTVHRAQHCLSLAAGFQMPGRFEVQREEVGERVTFGGQAGQFEGGLIVRRELG